MNSVTLLSPAKINLTLEVLDKKNYGYHHLRSIIQPIDLFDEIRLEVNEGDGVNLYIEGAVKIPQNYNNLIYKAASLYIEKSNYNAQITASIKKNIPLEAGLGGGSSNAAATLIGLNKILKKFNTNQLTNLASKLGADVPFFIKCRTSLVEGIGDKIRLLNKFPLMKYLIVKPDFGLSTKIVYQKYDEMHTGISDNNKLLNIDDTIDKYKNSEFVIKNDLEEPAISLNSKLKEVKDLMLELGCNNVSVTGSGTALFSILSKFKDADEIYSYLKDSDKYKVFLCKGIAGWHRL